MCTFVPNKLFGQLLDITLKDFIFLNTSDLEFSCNKVWFPDQNPKSLQMEDKINIALVFK